MTFVAVCTAGLHYEHAGNKLMQDMCFNTAEKLLVGSESKTFLKICEPVVQSLPISNQAMTQSKVSLSSSRPLRDSSNATMAHSVSGGQESAGGKEKTDHEDGGAGIAVPKTMTEGRTSQKELSAKQLSQLSIKV